MKCQVCEDPVVENLITCYDHRDRKSYKCVIRNCNYDKFRTNIICIKHYDAYHNWLKNNQKMNIDSSLKTWLKNL